MTINKNKIIDFLASANISVIKFENSAGLKRNAIHNILSGKSKNPSLDCIVKIADKLNCTIDELLDREVFLNTYSRKNNIPYNGKLMEDIINFVNNYIQSKNISQKLLASDFLHLLDKIYDFSFKKNNQTIDNQFAEWFVENQIIENPAPDQ
jgi:transcriptional regulator with XRE-family HTH domain